MSDPQDLGATPPEDSDDTEIEGADHASVPSFVPQLLIPLPPDIPRLSCVDAWPRVAWTYSFTLSAHPTR